MLYQCFINMFYVLLINNLVIYIYIYTFYCIKTNKTIHIKNNFSYIRATSLLLPWKETQGIASPFLLVKFLLYISWFLLTSLTIKIICVELFEAIFTQQISKCTPNITLKRYCLHYYTRNVCQTRWVHTCIYKNSRTCNM